MPSSEEIVIDPFYQEDQNQLLEASGTCLVNRNYIEPWLQTPFPDSFIPPINHHVSMIKMDPYHLYNSPIGIQHSTVTQVVTETRNDVTPATHPGLTYN